MSQLQPLAGRSVPELRKEALPFCGTFGCAPAGLTVKTVIFPRPLLVAVIVAAADAVTRAAVTVNVPLVWPAATVAVDGKLAAVAVLANLTTTPPAAGRPPPRRQLRTWYAISRPVQRTPGRRPVSRGIPSQQPSASDDLGACKIRRTDSASPGPAFDVAAGALTTDHRMPVSRPCPLQTGRLRAPLAGPPPRRCLLPPAGCRQHQLETTYATPMTDIVVSV